ncbi:MAG: efflux RND transporter permease subunit [Spirochaetaceae bacterium]|nr:MAG: efflux RND transporter permease subunit [Spirochaetaceae bacterium]
MKAIRAWSVLLLLVVLLVTLALRVRVDALPQRGDHTLLVSVRYPHADQDQIERRITIPIENQLARIRGAEEIESLTQAGRTRVQARFSASSDMDSVYLDVRDRIEYAAAGFPPAAQRPIISRGDLDSRPLFIAALPITNEHLVRELFEPVEGVGRVEISGAPQPVIEIDFDAAALPYQLSGGMTEVAHSVSRTHIVAATNAFGRPAAVVDSRLAGPHEFARIPLARGLTVADIATVQQSHAERTSIGRAHGQERALAYIYAAGNANSIEVGRRLRAVSASHGDIEILLDRAREAEQQLRAALLTMALGILGVLALTAICERSWRQAAIAASTVVFAALVAVAALAALSVKLTAVTVAGIALAAGLVIDNAVVFLTALRGNRGDVTLAVSRAARPIICASLTTIVVFAPLMFAAPAVVEQYAGLALVISASLSGALLFILLLLPALLRSPLPAAGTPCRSDRARRRGRFNSERLVDAVIRRCCRHRRLVLAGSLLITLAGIRAGYAMTAFPELDESLMTFTLQFSAATRAEVVQSRAQPLESAAAQLAGVQQVYADYTAERARLLLKLHQRADRRHIRDALQQASSDIEHSFSYVEEELQHNPARSIEIIARGPSLRQNQQILNRLARSFAEQIDHDQVVLHFRDGIAAHLLRINLKSAAQLGVDPQRILTEIRWMIGRQVVTKWHSNGREVDVVAGSNSVRHGSIEQLMRVPLFGQTRSIATAELVDLESLPQPSAITRIKRARGARMTVVTQNRTRTLQQLQRIVNQQPLPLPYTVEVAPHEYQRLQLHRSYLVGVVLAVALVAAVLTVHWESAAKVVLTMLQIPLVLAVPMLALAALRQQLNLPVFAGMILCSGVSVNNSIVVFDQLQHSTAGSRQCRSLDQLAAAVGAAFRPLGMAAITTLVAVSPLLLGSRHTSVLSLLSLTLTAGVLASLAATLVLLPVLSLYFPVRAAAPPPLDHQAR